MKRRDVDLGAVAAFVRGVTFKPDDVTTRDGPGTVACMRTSNVQKDLDTRDVWRIPDAAVKRVDQYLRRGDILVSSANSWNLVGKCCWVPDQRRPTTFGGFVSVLRANPAELDPRYAYWWFSSPRTQQLVRSFGRRTTSISNLDLARCLRLIISLPPLDEQRRIARVLNTAGGSLEAASMSSSLLGELARSAFVEVFGDPAVPDRWPAAPLGELARVVRGASPRPAGDPRYFGGDVPWLKISDITATAGRTVTQIKEGVTPAGAAKSVRVPPGSLVLTNSATVGIPKFLGIESCIHDGFLALLDIDASRVDPMFLYSTLLLRRKQIVSLAPEGTQKNLNTPIVKAIKIALPPLGAQLEYSDWFRRIEEQTTRCERRLATLATLVASLQRPAFSGAL